MWYKTAVTKMDLTGQLNIDFGDNYKKKINLEDLVDIRIVKVSNILTAIEVYLKNTNTLLGDLEFLYSPQYDIDKIGIEFIRINEYSDEEIENYMNALKKAGYDVDETSVSRKKWGIGNLLYKELRNYVKQNLPLVTSISGDIYSTEAFQSRNKIFGLPSNVTDSNDNEHITPNMTQEEIAQKIPSMEKMFPGIDIVKEDGRRQLVPKDPEGYLRVVHQV